MIDAAQIRAARALLDISQAELSKVASVSATSIKRVEAASEVRGAAETLWKLQTALEKAGVEFIPADELKGSGVRLRRPDAAKPKGRARTG
jgi:transcriptional regulator with XRE-family HTH domain